jgi:DNA repair protein RadC
MKKVKQKIGYSNEAELISKALHCLENKLRYASDNKMNNSKDVSAYVRLQLADEKEEVFAVLFLDNHFKLIAFEKLFYGTINESPVYPRKIVKKALEHNAAKLIIAHNHPSGLCNPSEADKMITTKIREILEIVDVGLVDHIVVTHMDTYSFAENLLL